MLNPHRLSEGERDNLARETKGIGPDYDYSYAKEEPDGNGHYSDIGKLPNHPTFSNQSAYSTPEYPGGTWDEIKKTFTPSPQMINSGATNGLATYMQRVEPNVKLVVPSPYRKDIFK